MATEAQLAANRANALLSTGPASPQGKARSSVNNLRHGFRSQSVLLPGDDPAEYQALLDELEAHFDPKGLTEQRFVREMADAEWRLRRVRAHQELLLAAKIDQLAPHHPGADPAFLQALACEALHKEPSFTQFLRYESKFERQYDRAYNGWMSTRDKLGRHELRQFEAQLKSTLAPLPRIAAAASEIQKLTDEPNSTPRNAPCPCRSGLKFKRCCGKHAPAAFGPPPQGAKAA